MNFCFGFHFYDVDPDRLSKILVNISWAIFHDIMGSHSRSIWRAENRSGL